MKRTNNHYKTNSHILLRKVEETVDSTAECACCRTIHKIPLEIVNFKRFHHHEERFIRYEGYLCPNCGYPTIYPKPELN